ncbi:type I restriction endonuclease [bacterium endosymbiont of Escarpia laminata]|nr:MAG: type I restriction endonuclease [bacterium endosymbiont of Escarpia laminata]
MSKFTEEKLEQAIITLLEGQGYPHHKGGSISRQASEVLIKGDLRAYLAERYARDNITEGEIDSIIRRLETLSPADLYESNKTIHKLVADGFLLKREPSANENNHRSQKDLYIQLIDYSGLPELRLPREGELESIVAESSAGYGADRNIYKIVNQLEIEGSERRIPDGILYINGLPLVVFEFKSAIREEATLHDAWVQLTTRYARDIPELMKYNALCVISDGVNSRMGSLFAPYDYFYTWRKVTGNETIEQDGINALHTMIQGLFDKDRLRQVIRHFIYFPDVSKQEVKVVCRYPQFYAANKLFRNIKLHRKPEGDGKGGTYFGATGCGKSFTMLFLTRLLMKSVDFESPTIVLITDRTDLDDQLSGQFTNAKGYIGDQTVISVESRSQLRELLKGRNSGGVFLTTIHKFTEDTELLTERDNVICISDEAHRSQVNLDQKVRVTEKGVQRSYGFAKYLHDSLPNATYVGFTGTPIDATLDVFGEVVDAYTMAESVKDGITVRIVYEGRAARVVLDNAKLEEIEAYYAQCAEDGASDYQIEESKKASVQMNSILGDPDRIKALAADFVKHYEKRVGEGSTLKGKVMFVCSKREIAYAFWRELVALRPQWNEMLAFEADATLTEQEQKTIKPMQRVKMVMTRGKDDPKELYDLLGNQEYRKELDRQFKNAKSNFKIAIVVDMWLTGFDVPFLDTIYIDKPIQRHNLIQTISRVNRKFEGKEKGLVVDYIGIKKQMNLALAHYNKADKQNIEEVEQSIIVVRDHLDLLNKLFHKFDTTPYHQGSPLEQLNCLNMAAEYAQITDKIEKRFMHLVKRLKAAYDICSGSEVLKQAERDQIHFYLAVRSIVFKLTKGNAPDSTQMNARVREMITEALKADGVAEVFKMGEDSAGATDIFDDDYLAKIEKIKLPNTRIKLLQQLLAKAIDDFKKVNKNKGMDFSKKLKALVDSYNERKEDDVLVSNVLEDFTDEIIDLLQALKKEKESFADLGIDFEEKAFYDILKGLAVKYDFEYGEEKLIALSKAVKTVVEDKARYTDWNRRDDIKAELKVDLIILLAEHGYPPVDRDEVYKEIFEQAENFKKHQARY